MDESELLELVRKAIGLHATTGCLEYVSDRLRARLQSDSASQALGTPEELKKILVRYVLAGGTIDCRRETRDEYQDQREFWFRALAPVTGYAYPLFFELELTDDDRDYPSVRILNVHFNSR